MPSKIIGVLCDFTLFSDTDPSGFQPGAKQHAATLVKLATEGNTIILLSHRLNVAGRQRQFIADVAELGLVYHDLWTGCGFPGLDEVYNAGQAQRDSDVADRVGDRIAADEGSDLRADRGDAAGAGDNPKRKRSRTKVESDRG